MIGQTILNSKKVCPGCGGKLELIDTVDNSNNPTKWRGCKTCEKFESGVDPKIHETAKILVDEFRHVHYSDMMNEKECYPEYWRKTQISGTANFLQKAFDIHSNIKQ